MTERAERDAWERAYERAIAEFATPNEGRQTLPRYSFRRGYEAAKSENAALRARLEAIRDLAARQGFDCDPDHDQGEKCGGNWTIEVCERVCVHRIARRALASTGELASRPVLEWCNCDMNGCDICPHDDCGCAVCEATEYEPRRMAFRAEEPASTERRALR